MTRNIKHEITINTPIYNGNAITWDGHRYDYYDPNHVETLVIEYDVPGESELEQLLRESLENNQHSPAQTLPGYHYPSHEVDNDGLSLSEFNCNSPVVREFPDEYYYSDGTLRDVV